MAESASDIREYVKSLIKKKEGTENEIKQLLEVLESQGGVGMDGPLVDDDQFPRSDIDVYTVRHTRHRVICLKNDLKDLMKVIEENMETYFQLVKNSGLSSGLDDMDVDSELNLSQQPVLDAFARVDLVSEGSPAHTAGLNVGDELLTFGSINAENFINMQTIAKVVQNSTGKSLAVTILRDGRKLTLTVIPKTWAGRGVLGCNIVPINRPER